MICTLELGAYEETAGGASSHARTHRFHCSKTVMRLGFRRLRYYAPMILHLLLSVALAFAQEPSARRQIFGEIDESRLQTLEGNIHPLARPQFDKGVAPNELPTRRMLLLLSLAPERQAALKNFLQEQQSVGSPNFRHWLTPAEFGRRFGPAESDLQTVVAWLQRQGFNIDRVASSRNVIEFSGTAGQVQQTFHAALHKYVINGQEHWANSVNPQIPAALSPVVSGLVSLNNFPQKRLSHITGVYRTDSSGVVVAESGTADNLGVSNPITPAGFATIQNTQPLLQGGTNGSGQVIAVLGHSNINLNDVTDFRNLFGLGAGIAAVAIDGPDPGILDGGEEDALSALEWASAAAPGASVILVSAQDTETTSGLDLASLYAVENNLAGIITENFGLCGGYRGTAGNQFMKALWQQAGAQGITVAMASGDGGAAGCDSPEIGNRPSTGQRHPTPQKSLVVSSPVALCQADRMPKDESSCKPSSLGVSFLGVSGSSVLAPSFAGIVALAAQTAGGRLGNVNDLLNNQATEAGASYTRPRRRAPIAHSPILSTATS